jgi:hypothetical protein
MSFARSTLVPSARFVVGLSFTLALAAAPVRGGFDVFSVGGTPLPASIQPTVDSFRAALGDPNNGSNPGPLGSGRREINWDGGGSMTASFTSGALTAFTNTRGATFLDPSLNPASGLLQSPLDAPELTSIQASYATTFSTFSNLRIFTPTGSNITEITFSVPGSMGATPATVSGFGAVFSDVDLAATTTIELIAVGGASLGVFNVPQGTPGAAPSATLSFLGLEANAGEEIARIRITTGNSALGPPDSNGNPVDVVVMDDFIYAEPQLIPEPGAAALVLLASLGITRLRRR